jgi:formylglycine-generating enzyme required for sulfatase activity
MKPKVKIFLAHASEDALVIKSLYSFLQTIGAEPWMAPTDIVPGTDWDAAIRKAILNADRVLACLSEHSVQKRGYIQREFKLALDLCEELPNGLTYLVPIRLDPCEIPHIRVGLVELSDLQWVDAFAEHSLEPFLKGLGLIETAEARALLSHSIHNASVLSEIDQYIYYNNLLNNMQSHKHSMMTSFGSNVWGSWMTGTRELFIKNIDESESEFFTNNIDGSEMVTIPAGECMIGDPNVPIMFDNQLPSHAMHKVLVAGFSISRFLITNEQYILFMNSTGYHLNGDYGAQIRHEDPKHPVTDVSWIDAMSYCQWVGGHLPMENEWEKAARGIDGRPFPWGWRTPHVHYCNFGNPMGGKTPVDRYPDGKSPFGCFDCAGNVWEWTATPVNKSELSIEQSTKFKESLYVVKGGSFYHPAETCRSGGRYFGDKTTHSKLWGFRIVLCDQI